MERGFQILEWSVSPDTNTLTCPEKSVRIEPKVMAVLVYMAARAGESVPKEQIIASVWEEKFISDEVLTVAVHELRKALGDEARNPRFIKTIPKVGYKLISPVTTVADPQQENQREDKGTDSDRSFGRNRRRAIAAAVGSLILVSLITTLVFYGWRSRSAESAKRITSVAVLPLENLSNDADQEFFADGMTDALITDLARVGSTKVISRTSVMKYREARKPLPEIARELNVDAIVEGTILRANDKIRINVQLIDASTDQHLWAEKFERPLQDVIALQSEVALAIARQIDRALSATNGVGSKPSHRVDPQVYEAYLRGRYFWNQRTREGAKKAIGYFEQSLAKDASYAAAYAGIADCYTFGDGNFLGLPREEALEKATRAATRALELDDSLSEAHTSLGALRFHQWDWEGSEASFKRAISLNPNSALAWQWYGELLSATARHPEAIAAMEQAQRLDPLEVMINADLAWIYYMARHYDRALDQGRKTLELGDVNWVRWIMGSIYRAKGMEQEALKSYQSALITGGVKPENLKNYGDVMSFYRGYVERAEKDPAIPAPLNLYVLLGEKEKALGLLEDRYRKREDLLWINVLPDLDELRSEPRFQDLLRRLRFES